MATNAELLQKLETANVKLKQSAEETIKQQNLMIMQLLTIITAIIQRNTE